MIIFYPFQYLRLARTLDGYGEISFPHCACDSRKDGHVIVTVGFQNLKLQACKDDGNVEVKKSRLLVVRSTMDPHLTHNRHFIINCLNVVRSLKSSNLPGTRSVSGKLTTKVWPSVSSIVALTKNHVGSRYLLHL